MEEIWIKVDDNYIVSNYGNVISKRRLGTKGGIIGCYDKPIDRYVIGMYGKTIPIHILVAKAFPDICGYWFEGCVVHHINEIKTDNRAENLQVMTREEHIKIHHNGAKRSKKTCENIRQSLIGKGIGRNNPNSKAILQLSPNGETIKEWPCIKECCEELSLKHQRVISEFYNKHSNIINYKGYILKRIN